MRAADSRPPGAVTVIVPGDLETRTGGYGYDRRMISGLRAIGWTVRLVRLDDTFPFPTAAARAEAAAALAAIADGEATIIDGLALGAVPDEAAAHASRLPIVALVHHPLALETGLTAEQAATLEASERRALTAARHVVVTSRATAATLSRYDVEPPRITTIEPGTDPAPLARIHREHRAREAAQHPAAEAPQHPGREAPQHPGREAPQHPAGEASEHLEREAPEHPGREASQHPAGEASEHLEREAPQHPAAEAPQHPGREAPQHPAGEASEHLEREAPQHCLNLLCVATLTPRKGYELLLDALASVPFDNWTLRCAGSADRDEATTARVRARLANPRLAARVELVGDLGPAALAAEYDRAGLFVLATLYEGYGMAVAEALARGLPVVSTATGVIADLVGGDAGLVVPPGDPAAFAAALGRVFADADLRARLAAGARCVRDRLPTWDTAVARMAEVLVRARDTSRG